MRKITPQPTLEFKAPKYAIAQLLRKQYGELNYKKGLEDLQAYCFINKKNTIANWLSIEAGEDTTISNLVIHRVLSFFSLQNESQLFTTEHKQIINGNK